MIDDNLVKKAKPGILIPIIQEVDYIHPVKYFANLSDYGRRKNAILFESADFVETYGEQSIGSAHPALKITGRAETFEIESLSEQGDHMLQMLKSDFKFCEKATYKKGKISGKLNPVRKNVDEMSRLKLKTHIDILRTIIKKFKPQNPPNFPYAGLFGAFSYDFIDQYEDLPKNDSDPLQDPDYVFYYLDNLFITDHKEQKTRFIANFIVTNESKMKTKERLEKTLKLYEKAIKANVKKKTFKPVKQTLDYDCSQEDFESTVSKMKEHIKQGDVVQVVPSRTIISNYAAEPLDIYQKLRNLNPSPYMFYVNDGDGILLGASPEVCVKVQDGIMNIRPIAGTKPRGLMNNKIDVDLDSRYETELKIDEKELAEHTMLVDLARNDVAKVCKPGTRYVDNPFYVEKYSHVQHLVSNVRGELKDGLDALHAYLASMNMGTLTGSPKVMAMKLIRRAESTKRGFYGGAVAYLTPSGNFDSTIVIRSMRLKNKKAYIRSGAGIVYDSIPESEFVETQKKAQACLRALELSGGLK